MNYKYVAEQLIKLLGGKSNISGNATCMTRLRVGIKNSSLVKLEELKKVEGVLGVVESDTLQIVLGPGKVNKVGVEFSKLSGISLGSVEENLEDLTKKNKAANKAKQTNPVQVFLKHIANIFVPLLPGIIAAGLINGIANVINVTTDNAYAGVWWYQLIRTLGWALFAYLPIFVAMNAAKEFKGSAVLGAIMGALSVSHAAMPLLSVVNDAQIVLPFTGKAFNPANGGLLAALISGILIAYVERAIRKVMPSVLDTFFSPLFALIIAGFISLIIIQPFGFYLTSGILGALTFLYEDLGVLGGYLLSATFLPLVSVGLHQALSPIHAILNDPAGATNGVNYLLPMLMMAGGGQVGAGLAIYLKTKSKKLKTLTRDSLPIGILGVGEPMMYAITLPLGKPFITACLGAGFGGVMSSIFKLGTVSQGVSGLFGLLIVQPEKWIQYVIAMLAAYAGGFVLTWFFGVDNDRIEEIYGE